MAEYQQHAKVKVEPYPMERIVDVTMEVDGEKEAGSNLGDLYCGHNFNTST